MVRNIERPPENHALRAKDEDGLADAMDHLERGARLAAEAGDLEQVRLYARAADRIAGERLGRMLGRRHADQAAETSGEWLEEQA